MTREEMNQEKREQIKQIGLQEKRKKIIKFSFKFLLFIIVLIALFYCYNYFIATTGIIVKEKRIISDKIPNSFNGEKIIHFSDLDYGSNIFLEDTQKAVKLINSRNPDIVVFTGDLIVSNYKLKKKEKKDLITELSKIKSSIGKYAVIGEQDKDTSIEILKQSGFTVLKNDYDLVYNNSNSPIIIVGLDSYLKGEKALDSAFDYFNIPEHNANIYTIVLMHEGDYYNELKEHKADLILAGHSHNGYMKIPKVGAMNKLKGSKKYWDEEYKFDDTYMYISSGIGTDGNGLRLFNHPSINLFRLSNY